MKLVVTSDWHVDHTTNGVRREQEIHRAVWATVDRAIAEKNNGDVLYTFLGDLCDPDSGREVAQASSLIVQVSQCLTRHQIPSLWLVGNHDVIEDGTAVTTLQALRPNGDDAFALAQLAMHPSVHCFGKYRILALPFTDTARTYDPAAVATKLGSEVGFDIVVGHLSIPGMQPGEETTEMPRGRDVLFPIKETEGKLRLNGHYHAQQSFMPEGSKTPIHIPGSLARLTFGEEDHKPSFLVIDVP